MRYTICDRCGNEFENNICRNAISLKDSIKKGSNTIKFKITLGIRASQQIITDKGSENISADICPNCAVGLLIKDVMKNLNY